MPTRLSSCVRLLATAGVASIVLAACHSGGGSAGPSTSPTVDAYAAALDLVRCLRANGQPNLPDPVKDDGGDWTLPASAEKTVPPACEALARTSKFSGGQATQPKVTSAEMASLRQFAACMRAKGFVDFPDPLEDGTFPQLTGQSKAHLESKDRTPDPGEEECKHQLPAGLHPQYASGDQP